MATTSYKLRISSLDKDALKASFVDYLKTTSEFQNFNENASGWSALLDLLAYNSYYQSMMANFAINETFMDTATKRQNVVSRAAELGYFPESKRAAKANLTVVVRNVTGNPSTLVLPTGTQFTTSVGNSSFSFVTIVPYSTNIAFDAQNTPYYQFDITVYEGMLAQNSFIVGADPSIDIPNMDIDTSTLRVFVTIDVTEYEFEQSSNFLSVQADNKVYFLSEGFDVYKVSFGDDTFGLQPPIGSTVRCSYLVTTGEAANGAAVFSFASSIAGSPIATVSVFTTTDAQGGSQAESIDAIKVNAGNQYAAQDRAVTANDFKALIVDSSPNVKDALVWGGQDNNPPIFGTVVACILPRYGDRITNYEEANIRALVQAKAVPNIGIVFVSPDYLNVVIESTVTYDSKTITLSTYDLQTLVHTNISELVSSNLTKFEGQMRYSNLISAIDRTDNSIVSNATTVKLKKKYSPTLYQNTAISFSFNNEIDNINKTYALKSTLFYVSGISSGVWIEDDNAGNLHLFYNKDGVKTYARYNIGTIDYQTGDVYINGINITGIDGATIDFVAFPHNNDIVSAGKTIIQVDSADIIVDTKVNQ